MRRADALSPLRRTLALLMGRRNAIPLADVPSLRHAARRTLALRVVLAAVLVGALVAAFLMSRGLDERPIAFLPPRGSGIVVLDLSASIDAANFPKLGRTLRRISESDGRYGFVLFSDTAYEALPPGTPAEELKPFTRYFFPRSPSAGSGTVLDDAPNYLQSPWSGFFSLGTSISSGLREARRVLVRDRLLGKGYVLLISDLANAPSDTPALGAVLADYRRLEIPIRVVGLSPSAADQRFFEGILGKGLRVTDVETFANERRQARASISGSFPFALVIVTLLVMGAFALNEIWGRRLEWGSGPSPERAA